MTYLPPRELFSRSVVSFSGDPDHSLTDDQCQQLVARYGSQSSAYFNLQSGVSRFGSADIGFVAYFPIRTIAGRFNLVFANPVCEPAMRYWLLRAFLKEVPGRHMFMGIDASVARDLEKAGLRINEFGTEFAIDVDGFSVAGKSKKQLRHASNLGKREGVTVCEQTWDTVDAGRVESISDQWRGHKAVGCRELRLLTRPPVMNNEWGVRKFYAYQGDRMLGYVFFDPYFENGEVVGYTANILRQDMDGAPTGLLDFIIIEAMNRFREEGIRELSLGISPLHGVQAMEGDRPLIRRVSQLVYEHGNRLYAFKALSYHKTRYRGRETKWYLATDQSSVPRVAWSILRGTGIMPLAPGLATS